MDRVSVNDMCVAYGNTHALDHMTIDIPVGTSVAVIGPNGSGKSTFLKVLAGVLPATTGSVDFGGLETAIVLQSTDVDQSVPISVWDTVAMSRYPQRGLLGRFRRADYLAVGNALQRVRLDDQAKRQLHHLSGGQRQRAMVAQGLAQEADILLLDEPFTGLDVNSQSIIDEVLQEERLSGRTTITSTHNFTEAAASDLVLLLATQCIAFGSPDEVLTEANLQRAFGGRFVRIGESLVLDDPHHHHH
jgi:manganese transport system ATP-binding protein